MEKDKEPFAYQYDHDNGNDFIITRASNSNTYFGKEANDLMFEMYKRQRNNDFYPNEFNNQLLIELNNRKEWARSNRYVLAADSSTNSPYMAQG